MPLEDAGQARRLGERQGDAAQLGGHDIPPDLDLGASLEVCGGRAYPQRAEGEEREELVTGTELDPGLDAVLGRHDRVPPFNGAPVSYAFVRRLYPTVVRRVGRLK